MSYGIGELIFDLRHTPHGKLRVDPIQHSQSQRSQRLEQQDAKDDPEDKRKWWAANLADSEENIDFAKFSLVLSEGVGYTI